MIKINVISNNVKWRKYLKNPNIFIEKKISKLNKKTSIFKKKIVFCTLLLSGGGEIKKLNRKFRKKNKTTDVLSFPFHTKTELEKKLKKDTEIYLGDIIVNISKVKNKKNTKLFKSEFDKLWIHGLVHLLGYDHKRDKDFHKMAKIEKKFFSYLK